MSATALRASLSVTASGYASAATISPIRPRSATLDVENRVAFTNATTTSWTNDGRPNANATGTLPIATSRSSALAIISRRRSIRSASTPDGSAATG